MKFTEAASLIEIAEYSLVVLDYTKGARQGDVLDGDTISFVPKHQSEERLASIILTCIKDFVSNGPEASRANQGENFLIVVENK